MKRNYFITTALACLIAVSAFAQGGRMGHKTEKIKALRVAFFTERLDLSPEEAQVFWPVYNDFLEEMEDVRTARREEMKGVKENFDSMSDKQIEGLVDGIVEFKQKEVDIQINYHNQFKEILPIKKVAQLYKTEREFKAWLLKQLKEQKQQGEMRRGGMHKPMLQERQF
ncbi:MAG: hypothetical protein IIA45_07235 [Bacteroidetes bacterium]|nr:hypothetical protein [Bacteroidota bacterium]